jgi:hypothetical protein
LLDLDAEAVLRTARDAGGHGLAVDVTVAATTSASPSSRGSVIHVSVIPAPQAP